MDTAFQKWNNAGKNNDRPGIYVIRSRATHSPAIKGSAEMEIILILISEIPDAATRLMPTGGVTCPIARFTVIMIPKCSGFTPIAWITGSKIGKNM